MILILQVREEIQTIPSNPPSPPTGPPTGGPGKEVAPPGGPASPGNPAPSRNHRSTS